MCIPGPQADPGVLISLGVPPKLRKEELSEVDAMSDEAVLVLKMLFDWRTVGQDKIWRRVVIYDYYYYSYC